MALLDLTAVLTTLVCLAVSYVIYLLVLKSRSEKTRATNRCFDPTAADGDEDMPLFDDEVPVCLHCGKTAEEAFGKEESSTKLKRCSRCMNALYCGVECSKAAWPIHKPICSQTRKLDIFAFAPVMASVAQLGKTLGIQIPNVEANLTNKALMHKVVKKELRKETGELVLDLAVNPEKKAASPDNLDVSGMPGPTSNQLHLAMVSDGHAAAASLGILLAFQQSITLYNAEHEGEKRVQLAYKGQRIKEYGLAVGRSKGPWALTYRYPDGVIVRRQTLKQHVWMYFSCEDGKTEVIIDVSATPLGGQTAVINSLEYLPRDGHLRKMLKAPPGSMLPAPIMSENGKSPTNLPQEFFYEQKLRIPLNEELWDRREYSNYHSYVEAEMDALQDETDTDWEGDEEEDGSGRPKGYLAPDKWQSAFLFYVLADETMKSALKEESYVHWPVDGYLKSVANAPPGSSRQA
eukprot:gene23954-9525_t